jgi:hypothetical protein
MFIRILALIVSTGVGLLGAWLGELLGVAIAAFSFASLLLCIASMCNEEA